MKTQDRVKHMILSTVQSITFIIHSFFDIMHLIIFYNLILMHVFSGLGKRFDEIKKKLTGLADKYPDLRDAYNVKIESAFNFQQNYQNRELVVQILNDLEKTFDEIERTLKKVTEGK